jgi:CPA2 family monovalent cation:H+ antiporter-2
MTGVALLLAAAAAGYAAARWLQLPPIPFLLVAGLGVSLAVPLPSAVVDDALILGVAFVVFVAGLELDPRRLGAQRRAAVRVGVVQFAVLAAAGFAVSTLLGFSAREAGYLALALTASSTLVGVRLLKRRQQMFEPFGRVVLGALLVQDLLVLLSIPFVTRLGAGAGVVLESLGAIALLGAACLAVRWWVAPLVMSVDGESELVLLSGLTVLFTFLGGASLLGVPLVVGAFLAGVALARFPVNGVVRAELSPVVDFFTALFFTALGARVGVPDAAELWRAGVLAALVLFVTPPLVTAVAERAGLAARPSLEAGLMLSQTSEISLVIGLAGVLQGDLGTGVFTIIAVVTMVTMLLTPVIATDEMARRLVHLHPSASPDDGGAGPPPAGHVLLLGGGSTGRRLREALTAAGCETVVVDEDPAVVERHRAAGARAIRGDGSDPAVLLRAGAGQARAVVSTLRRTRDSRAVLEAVADRVPVIVRVFDEEDAARVREDGGVPVLSSLGAAESLLAWYGDEREDLERRLAERVGAGTGRGGGRRAEG